MHLFKIIIFHLCLFIFFSPAENAVAKVKKKKGHVSASVLKKKKKKAPPKAVKPAVPKDIYLSKNAIYQNARRAAANPARTKLPQIDILNMLFRYYKDDERMIKYGCQFHITGQNFSRAYSLGKGHFEREPSESRLFRPAHAPAKIEYSNFQDMVLSMKKGNYRLDISMVKAYEQEIPFTFGARIDIRAVTFGGRLRSGKNNVTEIIFDNHREIIFRPPGIAFFVPDLYVKITSIVEKDGEAYGYVIGRPVSASDRFYAVRYNLSTCAKGSIKTYSLSSREFKRKFASADYFGFAD